MKHALFVRRRQPRAELPGDLHRLVLRKMPDAPEQRGEILAVDVFHREEVAPLDVADVVDAADVRVGDLPRDLDLVQKAGPSRRVRLDVARQELQRDALPELQIVGTIDLSHPAPTEQPIDPVSVRDHRPGRNRPSSNGVDSDRSRSVSGYEVRVRSTDSGCSALPQAGQYRLPPAARSEQAGQVIIARVSHDADQTAGTVPGHSCNRSGAKYFVIRAGRRRRIGIPCVQ